MIAGQCKVETAVWNSGIEVCRSGDDDFAVGLEHDGAGSGKCAAEAGGQRAPIAETTIRPAIARVTREGKNAGRAAGAGQLCNACDYDLAVRLNDQGADRVDVAKEVSSDLSVVPKSFVERAVGVVARDNEVFDRLRTAEARPGGDNLAVRLDGDGVSSIDVSRKVGSNCPG